MQRLSPLLQLILVSIAAHITLVAARITTSLYALSLHASEFTVGTLIALFAFFPMIFAVPMGRLIDQIGISKPIVGGCLLMTVGCAIPSVISGVPVLYLAALLVGTGFLAVHVSAQHAVGAMSLSASGASNFSWLATGYSVSSFLGPVVAGFVIDHARHAVAFAVAGGFALVSLLLVIFGKFDRLKTGRDREVRTSGSIFDLLRDVEMRRIYLISILLGSAWDLFNFVMPIHGSHLKFSASTIGLILGCFSAATFAVRLAMHWISRRYSEWQVLMSAMLLAVACYVLFPFMKEPLSIMIVAAALGLALGSSQPNVLALLHHTAPAGREGEAVGIRVTISNASQVALPLVFGAAGAALGLFAIFWGMGAMIGSGVPVAWRKASGKP